MIQHWLSEKGLKAIQIMGWPEWNAGQGVNEKAWRLDIDHHKRFLQRPVPRRRPRTHLRKCCSHVALCLLQHQARTTLLRDDSAFVAPILFGGQDQFTVRRSGPVGAEHWLAKSDELWWSAKGQNALRFSDFDEALINAVLSTEKK